MTSISRRSIAFGAAAVLLLIVALPACGGGSKSSKGYTIKAPVLWAGAGSNGQLNSGIENATVSAGDFEDPGFTIDLASVKAKDAGPQWLAASASAAAVATLLSGKDPAHVDLSYTITGQIVGADTRSTVTIPGLINSVVLADSNVQAQAGLLAARNVYPAYPRWSATWGVAAANALNGTGRDAAGEYLALNELWYDVINCSVLYAATTPS
jgi:hypothetical protein